MFFYGGGFMPLENVSEVLCVCRIPLWDNWSRRKTSYGPQRSIGASGTSKGLVEAGWSQIEIFRVDEGAAKIWLIFVGKYA